MATEIIDSKLIGSAVVILRNDIRVSVGIVKDMSLKLYRIKCDYDCYGGSFNRKNKVSSRYRHLRFEFVNHSEVDAIMQEIRDREERERIELYAAEQKKRDAEYAALPEEIKLARKLCWICDVTSEKKIALAPYDFLRGLIDWAEQNGLDSE